MSYSKEPYYETLIESGRKALEEAFQKHSERGVKRSPVEWTKQERRLGQSTGPLTNDGEIPYDFEITPWCEEPLMEAISDEVQFSVWWWASGLAKTETAVNLIGYTVCEAPTNIFCTRPNEKSVADFSQKVITPAIDSTPSLKERFAARKRTSDQNTIRNKRFAGGNLSIIAATSTNNFRGPRAGLIYCDEIDGNKKGGEGDRILLARARAFGYKAIEVFSGTGTYARTVDQHGKTIYNSTVDEWFDKTDQRKWFCQCKNPECRKEEHGGWQVLVYSQIKFNPLDLDTARYHCEFCDTPHTDRDRRVMVSKGHWIATKPENKGRRGYWLNGMVSLFPPGKGFSSSLVQWVTEELDALKAGKMAMRVRKNTFHSVLDEMDEEGEPAPEWDKLLKAREKYTSVPAKGLAIACGIDCQKNRIEVNYRAFGRDEESWGLDHVILPGEVQDEAVWKDLEKELLRKFKYHNGAEMELSTGLIDAGKWPDWVQKFLRDLRKNGSPLAGKIRACRGANTYPHPLVSNRYAVMAKTLFGFWVGGDEAKDLIYSRLRKGLDQENKDTAGLMHFNQQFDEEFFKQLTVERVSITYRNGEELRRYLNEGKARNEAIDTTVYGLAAFRLKRWDFDAIEESLKIKTIEELKKAEDKQEKEIAAQEIVGYSGGGWNL